MKSTGLARHPALILGLVLSTAVPTFAQVIYQQLPANSGQGVQADGEIAQPNFYQRTADDFILPAAATVTGAQWWGGSEVNFGSPLANISAFVVKIYASGPNNLPVEPPIFAQTIPVASVATVKTCGGLLIGGDREYQFSAAFSTPVNLNAGTRYWFHVGGVRIVFQHDAPLWSQSLQGNPGYATDSAPNDGVWSGSSVSPINNLAFRLTGGPAVTCNPADANCDSVVNAADVAALAAAMVGPAGTACSPCAGDVNGDGVVNGADVQAFVCAVTNS